MTQQATVRDHLGAVHQRIAAACALAGRDAASVRLIAVSKYRPVPQTLELYDAGHRAFGESRVQELREKAPSLPANVEWHLIGQLQTNKAKYLPGVATWVHSVDRGDLVDALEKAFAKTDQRLNVLLQVNVAGEEQKGGCPPEAVEALARQVLQSPHLELCGLMQIAPYLEDLQAVRPYFAAQRDLARTLEARISHPLPELSMGMSHDFEVAIEEGATMVRIGTALYEGF